MPSKTLIEGATQGLTLVEATERVRKVVAQIAASEDAGVLRSEGVHVIDGRARFSGKRRLAVGAERLTAPRIIIATGSFALLPQIGGLRGVDPLTNESVFDRAEAPRSLMIIGGGPIGCELARAYRRLGVGIVVVEAAECLLPREDPEVGALLGRPFVGAGIDVRLRTSVARVQRVGPDRIGCSLTDGSIVEADRVLISAGRLPSTHAADEMGRIAVSNALGRLAQTVHAYPTWSMAIRQTAGQFFMTTGSRDARPAER